MRFLNLVRVVTNLMTEVAEDLIFHSAEQLPLWPWNGISRVISVLFFPIVSEHLYKQTGARKYQIGSGRFNVLCEQKLKFKVTLLFLSETNN